MRLNKLKTLLKSLPFQEMALQRTNSQPAGASFSNLRKFKLLIAALEDHPFFENEVNYLKDSALSSTTADDVFITKDNGSEKIYIIASNLLTQLRGISLMLDKMVADEKPEVISLRLPDPPDLSGLLEDLETFKVAIEQVIVNPIINGELKVTKWETGSFWINLYLGSIAAVSLVGYIVWSALVLCKKFAEFEILHEITKSLKIKNESLEDLRKQQEVLTAGLIDSEARYIEGQAFNSHENERLERMKRSIKTFASMIQRGAEVQASLLAPETVQNLFPDFLNRKAIESKVSLLKDGPSEGE